MGWSGACIWDVWGVLLGCRGVHLGCMFVCGCVCASLFVCVCGMGTIEITLECVVPNVTASSCGVFRSLGVHGEVW